MSFSPVFPKKTGEKGCIYFFGLLIGTRSCSVVRGWFWAYLSVTKRPETALRLTGLVGMVLATAVPPFGLVVNVVPLAGAEDTSPEGAYPSLVRDENLPRLLS